LMGCFDLSNPVVVLRSQPQGGVISTENGDELTICAGDGISDAFDVTLTGNTGSNSQWIITDSDLNILGLPPGPPFDLDGAGPGICLIWHLSYANGIIGLEAGLNAANLEGCFDLSNPITVIRNQPEGGMLTGGPFTFCVGDGESDFIGEDEITLSDNSGAVSHWVVTDADGTILGLPPSFTAVDFDGAGNGTCVVYHLSYFDAIEGLMAEANIADLAGCFSLSNGIDVNRIQVAGGTLTGGPFGFCVGDGESDFIAADEITLSGNSGANAQWVVTDADGTILGLPPSFTDVDFDGAGAGTCFVYHLSYADGIEGLAADANIADLSGSCFNLSNGIAVNRGENTASSLEGGPFNFCVGNFEPDFIPEGAITLNEGTSENAGWIITDENGTILGLPASPYDVNFDFSGEGTCLIYYINYVDGLTGLAMESNIADLAGCFELSNSIAVNRTDPDAGVILGGPYTICAGDGIPDMLDTTDINIVGGATENVFWIVTDIDDNIIGLPPFFTDVNFDGAGPGICYIRRVTGVFEDGAGLAVDTNLDDLQGCFALSNRVTINRIQPAGGTLEGGPFNFCVGDGEGDFIGEDEITLSGNSGSNAQWVITDEDGTILGLPPSFTAVDFDGAGVGTCFVYHLSYEDGIEGLAAEANIAELAGCFNLSNGIPVNRIIPSGGTLEGGPFSFCVSDNIADMLEPGAITLSGNTGTNSQWVVTDGDGTILGLPPMPSVVDFDGAGDGACLIYNVSYVNIEGLEADSNVADLSGCFAISNSVTVDRIAVNGGSVTTVDGETSVDVTVNDGIDDIIEFVSTNAIGENFIYVITDENNEILGLPTDNFANFEGAGVGICRVWGLSYTGELLYEVGDIVGQVDPSAGCFAVSDIFLTVNRMGGAPFTPPGTSTTPASLVDVNLYPNPATNQLQLAFSNTRSAATPNTIEWMILQLDGKIVARNVIGADQLVSTIDVSQLSAGAYFLRINDGEQIISKRFLKAD
ncbi:MAG: T9SS type A sorting domain-containing protein, partial [Bacteroidota bacterium]